MLYCLYNLIIKSFFLKHFNTALSNSFSELELAEPSLEYTIVEALDDSNNDETVEQFDDEPNHDTLTARNDVSMNYPNNSILGIVTF